MASVLKQFANLLNPGPFQVPNGWLTIDQTSSLAQGLLGCWAPGVMGGIDLTGGDGWVPQLTPEANIRFSCTADGASDENNVSLGSNSGWRAPIPLGSPLLGQNQYTAFWRGMPLSGNASGFATIFGIVYDSTADTSPFAVFTIANDAGGTGFRVAWNHGGAGVTLTLSAVRATFINTVFDLCATGVVGGNVNTYVNGAADASVAFQTPAPTNSTSPLPGLSLAAYTSGLNRSPNSRTNIACIWNRALSAAEVMQMHLAPYSFLIPAEAEMPVSFMPPPPPLTLMPQILT